MKKTFYTISISCTLVFIGINTFFYFDIYNGQLDFQTGLLIRQAQLCGTSIEQDGMSFENELNYIPFADDFSRLFTDEGIRERGTENLQKLYTRYSDLINNVTVFDNQNNVYSLILDQDNNFVSDYYESQQQPHLEEREELTVNQDKYVLTIPDFDEDGIVRSNIVVDLNFTRFINSVFEKYFLENTNWPWLLSDNGQLIASSDKNIRVSQNDLDRVHALISGGDEGSVVHTIEVDGVPTKVVSAYYPIRFIRRDLGIVFSMKTDIFLRSIIIKIAIITLSSLFLLGLLLYIHFRLIKVKSDRDHMQRISGESLIKTMETLPVGMLIVAPGGDIRLMNPAAMKLLFKDPPEPSRQHNIKDIDLGEPSDVSGDSRYSSFLGPGNVITIDRGNGTTYLFKQEWTTQIAEIESRIIILFDITVLENSRNFNNIALQKKKELLESMRRELAVPLDRIQESFRKLRDGKLSAIQKEILDNLKKSRDLLSNLIDVLFDFSGQETEAVIIEEIPFSLRSEINMILSPLKALAGKSNSSIITKIRKEIPDRLTGDPFRLRQVITELAEASIEHTKDGRILISAGVLERYPDHIKIKFQVEDTGEGLPVDDKGNLPEDFEKTGSKLALARQQVELMKGQLWIESPSSISTDPEHPGTRYSFTIEVFINTSLKRENIFSDVKYIADIRCLILAQKKEPVESDRFNFLKELGLNFKYLIYRPDNMDSLLQLVREKSGDIHFLLLNDNAEEDGLKLAGTLKNSGIAGSHIRILLSSRPAPDSQWVYRNLHIDYHLEEPFEPYRMLEIISAHFPGIPAREIRKTSKGEKINPNISILLAEDNVFNRKIARTLFKSIGFEIDLAHNGKEVLDMIKNKKYDIVFMDLLMPEMDGLEATAEIRRQGYKMPVIALTAVSDHETKLTASRAGIDDYLIKPVTAWNVKDILLRNFSKTV